MSRRCSPTVRQRELARRLCELRKAWLLPQEQVAERLNWSLSKISRVETTAARGSWGEFSKSEDGMAALKQLIGLAAMAGGVVIAGHLTPVLLVLIAILGALALLVIVTAIFGGEVRGWNAREVLRILFRRRE